MPKLKYYHKHKLASVIATREYQRRIRKATLELMGGKCVICGFSDYRALQVDHVNGGGSKAKKLITRLYHNVVMESVLKGESKYQLLCANCNWIKRFEKGETNRKYC